MFELVSSHLAGHLEVLQVLWAQLTLQVPGVLFKPLTEPLHSICKHGSLVIDRTGRLGIHLVKGLGLLPDFLLHFLRNLCLNLVTHPCHHIASDPRVKHSFTVSNPDRDFVRCQSGFLMQLASRFKQ